MTTEELVETFLDEGRRAFIRHTAKKSPEIRKLLRHEVVVMNGVEFGCLQELVVYKTAEYFRQILPKCDMTVELDGNNSTIYLDLTDEEKRKLTQSLYVFLKQNKCLEG